MSAEPKEEEEYIQITGKSTARRGIVYKSVKTQNKDLQVGYLSKPIRHLLLVITIRIGYIYYTAELYALIIQLVP